MKSEIAFLRSIIESIKQIEVYTSVGYDYLEVDYEIVWGVTQRDLPPLKAAVEDILVWKG